MILPTGFLLSTMQDLSSFVSYNISSQASSIITSNITLSNSATSAAYHGYGLTTNNAGLKVVSDQAAQIVVQNTVSTIAEIKFDTISVGGTVSVFGVGGSSRGAYWYVGSGDAINIDLNGNVAIRNSGLVNSNYTLYVNGTVATTSTLTINGGGLQVANSTLTDSVFYSTNLTMYNGNFLQSNVNSITSYATFYSTAMTVHGSISTTGTLYCLGRLNTPNVANISTLIVGDNIASTALVSLDVNGSYRNRIQKFTTSGERININGGNLIYVVNGSGLVLFLPDSDSRAVGTLFTLHSENTGTMYLSTVNGAYINTPGNHVFPITKNSAITSLFCLEPNAWTIITSA